MNLEQEFDRRIAAIHGLSNPPTATSHTGGDSIDVRHAEFQAMADVFLGEDFDRAKLEHVERLQITLHEHQAALSQRYKEKALSPEQYVDAVNNLLQDTFMQCETILGYNDFLKFFGAPREEMSGFIDREAFLHAHSLSG